MKKALLMVMVMTVTAMWLGCQQPKPTEKPASGPVMFISGDHRSGIIDTLIRAYGESNRFRIERGVKQVASLWRESDGTADDFRNFCTQHFIGKEEDLEVLFTKLSRYLEVINGNFGKMILQLNEPLDLDVGKLTAIDEMFGAFNPASHVNEDFYANKIAFIVALNFPFYSLKEKTDMGVEWTRQQWAYARMGDLFTSRVPPELYQALYKAGTESNTYIQSYNIYMGKLVDSAMNTLFPADLRLITHWGLRDELKAHYNEGTGLVKQQMIYQVMKRIIDQTIPVEVIDKNDYQWDPYLNKVYKDGQTVTFKSEPDMRYAYWLNNFKAMKAIDPYQPNYPNYVDRNFELEMEIPYADVEKMFVDFISSPVIRDVGRLIRERLGRNLQPFDIWYSGFKSRSSLSEEELNRIVNAKYPSREAFEKDLPNILMKVGFTPEKAADIASKIQVDASRGIGHAAGAEMKSEKAHLRTRIGPQGMNYKGYNIATHEFGHNVEQTLSLQDVDYYLLNGVPNTAFTEALAFMFQKRDLELLGIKDDDPDRDKMLALDNAWAAYEIMGVSLVDMYTWRWMYAHPDATPVQLKEAVITIAKDIWNKYYADVFGMQDEPILAIYSHMIYRTIYLPAYPVGHLIDFQLEQHMKGKNFADEVQRIYTQGTVVPQVWMRQAVGSGISGKATLDAAAAAVVSVD
ncbi:MAG TPA: hypothetical protein PK711_00965 [Bacteroidales bacterium]|nr:hypothetical protein [Bacteroidales bacterium]HRZ20340.1 hypothetical protein [Bacteroidales bacterium]